MATINAIGTPQIILGGAFTMSGAFTFTGTITANTAVTFPTSGTLATTTQVLNFVNQSTTSATAVVGSLYGITEASATTITLPVTAAVGAIVGIVGLGAGGWILAPGAGQSIKILGQNAATSITSAGANDSIFVICLVANTTWVAYSFNTNGFTYS